MAKKLLILVLSIFCISSFCARAQMSDAAIIKYITEGVAAGKSETMLGTELMAKGVSTSQLQRLLNTYKTGKKTTTTFTAGINPTNKLDDASRERSRFSDEDLREDEVEQSRDLRGPVPATDSTAKENPLLTSDGKKRIYGHDLFAKGPLSFEPNQNAATPEDYVLGPGDQIIIDVWGMNEASISQTISPEGRIMVSQVGPVYLSGLTIKQAREKIRKAFRNVYSGVEGKASDISVTLGKIRTIQVHITGEVVAQGTYRLSSFSTVFNALYTAGGITDIGSMRNVKVIRGGEEIASVDLYEYLFNGRSSQNITLKEDDFIHVPTYTTLVSAEGGVRRPMYYELKPDDRISDLISYAGGFSSDAFKDDVTVERLSGRQKMVFTLNDSDSGSFVLNDGDAITVGVSTGRMGYSNSVEIRGEVYHPGKYEIGREIATVKQLLEHAGVMDNAYMSRAQIVREKADRTNEILAFSVSCVLDGTSSDILLKKNDVVIISDVREIEKKGDIIIYGYVQNPGPYEYAENMSVEDLILLAGGLSEGASTAKVDVGRRIDNPNATSAQDTIAQVFSFNIKDGLLVNGTPNFTFMPNDVVSIRKSPSYIEQKNINITGEVTFPGQYTLTTNNDRLSDLIKRAGGPTPFANVQGALLKRQISQYERNVRIAMGRMAMQNIDKDSTIVDKLKVSELYTVGLELDKALANPGSQYDIELKDGDELVIPEMTSTVRIQGEVLYPNTVHYIHTKNVKYYVHQAGGYTDKARRSKVYVIYMNGKVATGLLAKVRPGCEIVVPTKPERERMSMSEIMSIGSSAASLSTMIITIASLIKNSQQ